MCCEAEALEVNAHLYVRAGRQHWVAVGTKDEVSTNKGTGQDSLPLHTRTMCRGGPSIYLSTRQRGTLNARLNSPAPDE